MTPRLRTVYRSAFPRPWPRQVVAAPPKCPPGWTIAPPDFVGVGVQRAGTTWWHSMIARHPAVAATPDGRKELHFFDRQFDDGARISADTYARFFPRPDGAIAGEWTPRYMHDFWAPQRLAEAAPSARLLVLLRDPIDRYRSGVSFALDHNAPRHQIVASDATERGFYSRQLTRVLRYFERSQVLVLQLEKCIADPEAELARTHAFLGLDPQPAPADLREVRHRGSRPAVLSDEHRRLLVETYVDDVTALFSNFPELDPDLWRNFAEAIG